MKWWRLNEYKEQLEANQGPYMSTYTDQCHLRTSYCDDARNVLGSTEPSLINKSGGKFRGKMVHLEEYQWSMADHDRKKMLKLVAKSVVGNVKNKDFDDLYDKLDTPLGGKKIRLATSRHVASGHPNRVVKTKLPNLSG